MLCHQLQCKVNKLVTMNIPNKDLLGRWLKSLKHEEKSNTSLSIRNHIYVIVQLFLHICIQQYMYPNTLQLSNYKITYREKMITEPTSCPLYIYGQYNPQ